MEADTRVGVNEYAVVSLALYGSQDRVENLYRQTRRTVKRLRLNIKGAEPFKTVPSGQGSQPNIHDVVRWLDGIKRTRKYKVEFNLLKRLHVTALARVRPEVLTETEEPQGLH